MSNAARDGGWRGRVSAESRLQILRFLDEQKASLPLAQISKAIGKTCATTHQLLGALKTDKLVEPVREGRSVRWRRTRKAIPASFTPTFHSAQRARKAAPGARALSDLLGKPPQDPSKLGEVRVHRLKGG